MGYTGFFSDPKEERKYLQKLNQMDDFELLGVDPDDPNFQEELQDAIANIRRDIAIIRGEEGQISMYSELSGQLYNGMSVKQLEAFERRVEEAYKKHDEIHSFFRGEPDRNSATEKDPLSEPYRGPAAVNKSEQGVATERTDLYGDDPFADLAGLVPEDVQFGQAYLSDPPEQGSVKAEPENEKPVWGPPKSQQSKKAGGLTPEQGFDPDYPTMREQNPDLGFADRVIANYESNYTAPGGGSQNVSVFLEVDGEYVDPSLPYEWTPREPEPWMVELGDGQDSNTETRRFGTVVDEEGAIEAELVLEPKEWGWAVRMESEPKFNLEDTQIIEKPTVEETLRETQEFEAVQFDPVVEDKEPSRFLTAFTSVGKIFVNSVHFVIDVAKKIGASATINDSQTIKILHDSAEGKELSSNYSTFTSSDSSEKIVIGEGSEKITDSSTISQEAVAAARAIADSQQKSATVSDEVDPKSKAEKLENDKSRDTVLSR